MSNTGQLVTMSGVAAIINPNTKLIGTIPEEFRPNRNLEFWTNQNNTAMLVVVGQDGNIYGYYMDTTQGIVSFDGITYTRNKSF